eukprot:TRINITY_DN2949_c0_g1_i5.p1 TRINITY_DN2949_c0_g1~~TRINITY_DN2949_c0_g1_i5.p1  ORF type:complete len:194 (+),score=20.21 TRINITY_DN2949_c0_g1_i5:25-582(+)
MHSISIRTAMVVVTVMCVLVTSGTICALVMTDSFRSIRNLNGQARQSVEDLAGVMVDQSLAEATATVRDLFAVVSELSAHQLTTLRRRNVTSLLTKEIRQSLLQYQMDVLALFSAPAVLSLTGVDGTSVAVRKGDPSYVLSVGPNITGTFALLTDGAIGVEVPTVLDLRVTDYAQGRGLCGHAAP